MFKNVIFIILLIITTLALAGCTLTASQQNTSNLPPQINSFNANPSILENGQEATLSWEVINAKSVIIVPGLNNVISSGSERVNPARTTQYTIMATNEFGTSKSTLTLAVTENAADTRAGQPVIVSFKASPGNIFAGGDAVLSWEVKNATSISIEWEGDSYYTDTDLISGSIALHPYIPTIYTLTAKSASEFSTAQTAITIKNDILYTGTTEKGEGPVVEGGGCG